jgi:hypothetical protein
MLISIGAAADQDCEAIGKSGLGRGLDRHRDAVTRAHRAHEADHALELRGIEQSRRASPDRSPCERERTTLVERAPHNTRLTLERREVGPGGIGRRHGSREQVAEPAPLLAERHMDVEKQRLATLARPQRPQGHGWIDAAVRRLVRVGVHVRLEARGVEGVHSRISAYGTCVTIGCATRWPT